MNKKDQHPEPKPSSMTPEERQRLRSKVKQFVDAWNQKCRMPAKREAPPRG